VAGTAAGTQEEVQVGMDPFSRRTAIVGAIGLAGAAVVGCTTAQSAPPASPANSGVPATTPSGSATPTQDATPRWPLTGKPLKDGDDPKHVAIAVKVPDNKREHIHNGMQVQQGLNDADIVFVENDGYSSLPSGEAGTRLVPVFHTKYAPTVQAVRSMRPVDAALFSPITGILGSTGGTGWVLKYMKQFPNYFTPIDYQSAKAKFGGKLVAYGINAPFVFTIGGNTYYDKAVTCHPPKLATLAKKFTDGPQQNYFPWADADQASTLNGEPATTIKVPWAKKMNWTMSYTWDAGKKTYLRSMPWGPHLLAGNKRVTTDNVLVILAPITYGRINKAGEITTGKSHPEPIYHVINGTGKFYYANGGKYVTGTWTKGAINETFAFTLDDGSPLKMAPGRTFVELPGGSAKVKFTA
jgi:hypothetical protein